MSPNLDIKLSSDEVDFLMSRLNIRNPDRAIDAFIELLVNEGVNPMKMREYLNKWIRRTQC